MKNLIWLLALGAILAACTQPADDSGDATTGGIEPAATTGGEMETVSAQWAEVEPIFTNNCAPCHTRDKSGGVRLTSEEDAAPEAGEIVGSVKGEHGKLMPLNGDKLPDDEIAIIEAWADQV